MDEDYQLALLLQKELNKDEPEIINENKWRGKENQPSASKKTSSLVDPQWEFIDPTPDVHVLFIQFNQRFFWNKLHMVEVRWSPRMTSCAGVCVYQGKSGFCSVRLSLPLLKLRPRKDLVETLLHEMIHAYLFVTKNNRDRDGHGPEFHKHMNRINQEAGTHISVYHSFHDEVRLYQQHWWRCNGPCQKRPPFFGMVRRSMNRAPGPNDNWWAQHQATCGGVFIKVREPEDTKKKPSEAKKKPIDKGTGGKGDVRSYFPGSASSSGGSIAGKPGNVPKVGLGGSNKLNNPSGIGGFGASTSSKSPVKPMGSHHPEIFRKPSMNNVHGFEGDVSSLVKPVANTAVNNVFGFKDLNGQGARGKSKPSSSNQPSGKGYILGGSEKPPFPRGGGMLANRGGGTLVVSGTTNKSPHVSTNTSSASTLSTTAAIKTFSGAGHVLGKGAPSLNPSRPSNLATGRPKPFQKNVPVATNSSVGLQIPVAGNKRSPSTPFDNTLPKKKSLDVSSNVEASTSSQLLKVNCPVCNQQVLESVINSHLDDCVNGSLDSPSDAQNVKTAASSDVIVLDDSSDEEESNKTESVVNCPCCDEKIMQNRLESHLSCCVGSSFSEDNDDVIVPNDDGDKMAKCPICLESFPAAYMDRHLDNCASCSVQDLSGVFDENFSDEEEDEAVGSSPKQVSESGERLYPCPCCLTLIETTKMNEHLDTCVV